MSPAKRTYKGLWKIANEVYEGNKACIVWTLFYSALMLHLFGPLYHICDIGKVLLMKSDNILHGIKKDGLTYYGKLLYETNIKI